MRRATIAVLMACMLSVAGVTVVSAHEPSPGVASNGQRVEVPESAYVVTFPEGWVVGIDPMETSTASPDGSSSESVFMAAYGWAPDGSTQCLVSNEPLSDPPGDPATALEESADWALSHYEPVLIETSSLDLPAGPAIRYVFESEGTVGAAYLFSDGFDLFLISCLGARPPADRWLSIAETFEFLPVKE